MSLLQQQSSTEFTEIDLILVRFASLQSTNSILMNREQEGIKSLEKLRELYNSYINVNLF